MDNATARSYLVSLYETASVAALPSNTKELSHTIRNLFDYLPLFKKDHPLANARAYEVYRFSTLMRNAGEATK